jgi:hypothetical protein
MENMSNDPAVFASHIQSSMTPEVERVAKSYIDSGYFQVSRTNRQVARLPPGTRGRAALAQAAKERNQGPTFQRVIEEMGEAQATRFYLKNYAPRTELDKPTWLAFRRLGGKAYGAPGTRVQERMSDESRDLALEVAKRDGWRPLSSEKDRWERLSYKVRHLPPIMTTNALARAYAIPVVGMPATHIVGQAHWATRIESAELGRESNRPRVTARVQGRMVNYYRNVRNEWMSATGAKLLVGIALES